MVRVNTLTANVLTNYLAPSNLAGLNVKEISGITVAVVLLVTGGLIFTSLSMICIRAKIIHHQQRKSEANIIPKTDAHYYEVSSICLFNVI